MEKLTREDLYSLEEYSAKRPEYRQQIMTHKKNRVLRLGEHATLHLEDRLLMQYQIQEMLRAEKISWIAVSVLLRKFTESTMIRFFACFVPVSASKPCFTCKSLR